MRKEIQDGKVRLSGCLGERYIGCGMREGVLHVEGTPGNALACYLDGGTILVDGNAQDAVADTMNAGLLAVRGSAGDALAYGMRGGCVYILGDAGYRAGVHMKAYEENRSTLVVGGRTGSFLGEYLAGGLIVVIYLRTAKAPVNLSDKLVLRHVDEKEREAVLRPVVAPFAATFSLDVEECLSGDFIAIEADKSKTYSQLYAAV